MKRMNLGCGPDLKEGWVNVDNFYDCDLTWDVREPFPPEHEEQYDFVLVNHVLCTMIPCDVDKVLKNCYDILKPGGKLEVIDVDLLRAFDYHKQGEAHALPIEGGDDDYKLCMHLSGYGTRLSLFTVKHLSNLLKQAGFQSPTYYMFSSNNHRYHESLILEATK